MNEWITEATKLYMKNRPRRNKNELGRQAVEEGIMMTHDDATN